MVRWVSCVGLATLVCFAGAIFAVHQNSSRGPDPIIAALAVPKLKTISPIVRVGSCSGSNSCCCQIGFQANCTTSADCSAVGGKCVRSHPSC